MEAICTLYEMTLYSDFGSLLEKILHHHCSIKIKLPTMLLNEIMKKATNPLEFKDIHFQSALDGQLLAQSGRQSASITLDGCVFGSAAEEAFVDEVLSKTDRNCGLTGICLRETSPFCSEQSMIRLISGQNGLTAFSFLYPDTHYSEEMLDCLLDNSPGLQSLELCDDNFVDDEYSFFMSSLHSSSLRSLTIHGWNFREIDFPMEVFQNLALTHFSILFPTFDEEDWRKLLPEISKCATLRSLEFKYIEWWGSQERDIAAVEFALEMAQFLKNNPNIVSTNTNDFMSDDYNDDGKDDVIYTTYMALILEHHRLQMEHRCLTENLKSFKQRGNYKVRGFLVAEAVGTRYATKVSSCYTMLRMNMDVLVSYLSSRPLARGKKRAICSLHN